MRPYLKRSACLLLFAFVSILFSGCAEEKNNPIAVQNVGGEPPTNETIMMDLDARGFVNGVFHPGTDISISTINYPVKYTGDWRVIKNENIGGYYIIMSETPGARVDIVASMSRVVFEFWNSDSYSNPGTIKFELDGADLGEYDLKSGLGNDGEINHYQVTTGKSNLGSTVSMKLLTGTVVISGYLLVFPPRTTVSDSIASVRAADDVLNDKQYPGDNETGK